MRPRQKLFLSLKTLDRICLDNTIGYQLEISLRGALLVWLENSWSNTNNV